MVKAGQKSLFDNFRPQWAKDNYIYIFFKLEGGENV